jgi:hypothetical protein
MRRIVAIILVSLLVAPPAAAAQKAGEPFTWQDALTLKAGTEILLTVTGGQPTKVRFLFADDTMLLTLNPARPNLSPHVEHALVGIGMQWPAILDGGLTLGGNGVRVSQDGVFDGSQKVGDLAELTQQTPRGDILAVSAVPRSHRVRNIAVVAAIAGAMILISLLTTVLPGG